MTENTDVSSGVRRMLGLGLDSWNNVMALALAIGAFAAVVVGVSQYIIIQLQKAEAKDAAAAFERYKIGVEAQVADAKREGIEAGKRAGPRNIRGDDRGKMKSALETYRGTPYDLTFAPINDPAPFQFNLLEPGSFLISDLVVVLTKLSGWELHSVEGSIPKAPMPSTIAVMSLDSDTITSGKSFTVPLIYVGQISGIAGVKIVISPDPSRMKAVQALTQALNSVGIWADFEMYPSHSSIPAGSFSNDAVHIIVGSKP
jgi:hypothetical protein